MTCAACHAPDCLHEDAIYAGLAFPHPARPSVQTIARDHGRRGGAGTPSARVVSAVSAFPHAAGDSRG